MELAKQKKVLEDKRNFVNQVPPGGFAKAFGEHEINYKQMKDDREAAISKKREEEKAQLKNHYGSLKFKPKKHAAGDLNSQLQTSLAYSVDAANPVEGGGNLLGSPRAGRGILSNRFLDEIRNKEFAK